MNTKNNKRRKESVKKIEKAFFDLMQYSDIKDITVTDICKKAELNRSTFYANYLDIIDLAEKIKDKMIEDFNDLYSDEHSNNYNSNDYLKLFEHIKENQLFYKTYFKLGLDNSFDITRYDTNLSKKYYDDKNIKYHMEFFRAGITSIIKMWLNNGCDLSSKELFEIIKEEYQGK